MPNRLIGRWNSLPTADGHHHNSTLPPLPKPRPLKSKQLTPQTGCINHIGLTVLSVPHSERDFYAPLLTFLGFRNSRPYKTSAPSTCSHETAAANLKVNDTCHGPRSSTPPKRVGPGKSVWSHPDHVFGIILYDAVRGGAGSRGGAIGLQHLCLNAGSRGEVDEVARMCRRMGLEFDGPEEMATSPGYYACHLHDNNGIHMEIAYTPGLWDDPSSPRKDLTTTAQEVSDQEAEDHRSSAVRQHSPLPPPQAYDFRRSSSIDHRRGNNNDDADDFSGGGWSSPRPLSPASAEKFRDLQIYSTTLKTGNSRTAFQPSIASRMKTPRNYHHSSSQPAWTSRSNYDGSLSSGNVRLPPIVRGRG